VQSDYRYSRRTRGCAEGKGFLTLRFPVAFFRIHTSSLIALLISVAAILPARGQSITKSADGFDLPVAPPNGEGYYKSRGFRSGGHLGEDWLVIDGSSKKSLGQPVYAIGTGLVVLARDIHAAWGNVVIVRHAWIEQRQLRFADSLYAHLDRISVREGQQIKRGQLVGTIGSNHGMYPPHLHFEIHKDLSIGVNHQAGTRDLRSYWLPTEFIMARRRLDGGGRNVPTPAADFVLPTPDHPWYSRRSRGREKGSHSSQRTGTTYRKPGSPGTYRVNRYQ